MTESKNLAKTVGHNLKQLRQKAGFTQKELGEMLGMTFRSVTANEQGITFPRVPTLIYLADLYDVSTDEMLGRSKIVVNQRLYPKLNQLAALANMPVNEFVNKHLENLIAQFSSTLNELEDVKDRAQNAVQSLVEN